MKGDTRIAQSRSSENSLMDFERKQEAKGGTYKERKSGVCKEKMARPLTGAKTFLVLHKRE